MAVGKYAGSGFWALILGGSSGIGLATAKKLWSEGMHVIIVHRDRRQDIPRIEAEFAPMMNQETKLIRLNINALKEGSEREALAELKAAKGKVRVLLHALTRGNLKRLQTESVPVLPDFSKDFPAGWDAIHHLLQSPPAQEGEPSLSEADFLHTISAMASSLWRWTQALIQQEFFAEDARIIGLTSEGNQKIWPYYAAVSVAKSALESLARTMAVELAPLGIRTNILQPGVTDTPSLRKIPGEQALRASALSRNPFGRLTLPEDVANVISLLASEEAAWINGALIPVDGGERLR